MSNAASSTAGRPASERRKNVSLRFHYMAVCWRIRRWVRLGLARNFVVEFDGAAIRSVRKGFAGAVLDSFPDRKASPRARLRLCHHGRRSRKNRISLWVETRLRGLQEAQHIKGLCPDEATHVAERHWRNRDRQRTVGKKPRRASEVRAGMEHRLVVVYDLFSCSRVATFAARAALG
jgi:hypothetical protein